MDSKTEQANIHSSTPGEYVHELDSGTLTVSFSKGKDIKIMDVNRNVIARVASSEFIVTMTFNSESGETFDAAYSSSALGATHPLLTLEDEARVVFSTKPSMVRIVGNEFEVNFIAHSSTKAYPFALTLRPVSTPSLSDIPKLQAENLILRRQLRDLTAKVEYEEKRTDHAIDAIKDLIFDAWGENVDYFDELCVIADRGCPFIRNAFPALICDSDQMWYCLLENGYANNMMRGTDHILIGSTDNSDMPKFHPMAIKRLILLVDYMSPKRLEALRFNKDTSVLQKIEQHLTNHPQKLPESIRTQWISLRDAIIKKLAQPRVSA